LSKKIVGFFLNSALLLLIQISGYFQKIGRAGYLDHHCVMTHKLHTDASNALHIRVNNIQGRENQAETPEKWGKKRWRIFP
jgi:hypothetical protein